MQNRSRVVSKETKRSRWGLLLVWAWVEVLIAVGTGTRAQASPEFRLDTPIVPSNSTKWDRFGWVMAADHGRLVVATTLPNRADPERVGGVFVFDADTEQEIRSYPLLPHLPQARAEANLLVLDGGLLLTAAGSGGPASLLDSATGEYLSVLRLTNPPPSEHAHSLDMDDGVALLQVDSSTYLFDVSDPRRPRQVAQVENNFAYRVALDGRVALLGIPSRDYDTTPPGQGRIFSAGAATLYDLSDPADPQLLTTLVPPELYPLGGFGRNLALDGNLAAIQADTSRGSVVYVFDVSDPSHPVELAALQGSDTTPPADGQPSNSSFGISIAIDDGYILVGDAVADRPEPGYGAAYLFDATDLNNIHEVARYRQAPGASSSGFGATVALDGQYGFIAAASGPFDNTPPVGPPPGRVYRFTVPEPGITAWLFIGAIGILRRRSR